MSNIAASLELDLSATPEVETAKVIAGHFFCKQRKVTGKTPKEAVDNLLVAIVKAGLKLRVDE